jgi:hypothetical protein
MPILLLMKSAPPAWLPYALAGAAALILVAVLLRRWLARKRADALAAAAMQVGLSFQAEAEVLPAVEMERFHVFTVGHHHRVRNVMRGSSGGLDIVVCDYLYITGSGKNQSRHEQTVAAFHLRQAKLPGFDLRHENILYKIAALFGYRDINIADHPEFSRRYLLRGADENAVCRLFSGPLADFFQSLPREKDWFVEGNGEWVLVYRFSQKADPARLAEFLQETTTIASAFEKSAGAAKFGW